MYRKTADSKYRIGIRIKRSFSIGVGDNSEQARCFALGAGADARSQHSDYFGKQKASSRLKNLSVWAVSVLTALIAMMFLFSGIAFCGEDEEGSADLAELRSRLRAMEKQLESRSSEAMTPLAARVLSRAGAVSTEAGGAAPPIVVGPAAAGVSKVAGKDDKKEPGSVSVGLGGGKLTAFNVSSQGLDFADSGDVKLKLMLDSDSEDVKAQEQDGDMRGSFSGSGSSSFYGTQNYERFKDLFSEEEKSKDYQITGLGFSFDVAGLEMSALNYSKPPKLKKVVFFGQDTPGPYKIQSTNILPGTEKVRVGGSELTRGASYTILYSRGEITFDRSLGVNERVVVEYETPGGSGGAPGKLTGFRLQTISESRDSKAGDAISDNQNILKQKSDLRDAAAQEQSAIKDSSEGLNSETDVDARATGTFGIGKFSIDKWGVSYLSDEAVDYRMADGVAIKRELAHQLIGIDGMAAVGKSTTVEFEAAQSVGAKQRELGRHARTLFSISDSKASDGNPLGPYYIDENELPVIEGSDEVRVNGEELTRDTDYTLDLDYGALRIRKQGLNLSDLDVIELTHRYLTEEDKVSGESESKTDVASLVSMKNTWKGLTHNYTIESRGADFTQVGGRSGNQLDSEKQDIAWKGDGGLALAWGRSRSSALQDAATGLTRTNEANNVGADYAKGAVKVSLKKDTTEQFDNAETRGVDSTKDNIGATASYDISDKYSVSFNGKRSDGRDLRADAVSVTSSSERGYQLKAKPTKTLGVDLKYGEGESAAEASGRSRLTGKQTSDISMNYRPNKRLRLNFDASRSVFENEEFALSGESAAEPVVSPPTGNSEIKIRATHQPMRNMNVIVQRKTSSSRQVTGETDKTQSLLDLRHKFNDRLDFQYQYVSTGSDRPNQSQSADMESVSVKTQAPWFDGMEITLKRDTQKTRVEMLVERATRMESESTTDRISVKCAPIWKERNVSVEFSNRNGGQAIDTEDTETQQEDTGDGESTWKFGVELPFARGSFWSVKREISKRNGRLSTKRENLDVSLNGSPLPDATIQLSYREETYSDMNNPQSNRQDSTINIVIKKNYSW